MKIALGVLAAMLLVGASLLATQFDAPVEVPPAPSSPVADPLDDVWIDENGGVVWEGSLVADVTVRNHTDHTADYVITAHVDNGAVVWGVDEIVVNSVEPGETRVVEATFPGVDAGVGLNKIAEVIRTPIGDT